MRALMCAAAMACVLSGAAQADVITQNRTVSASSQALQNDLVSYDFEPFNPASGTVTAVTVTFGGVLNTGAQPVRTFPGEPAPATVVLTSTVRLLVAGVPFEQQLPPQTSPVSGGVALSRDVSFSLTRDVPFSTAFLADPSVAVRAFTGVSRTDGGGLNNGGANTDPTSLGGVLTLAYTYTPAAVPEPVSLSLLGLGLAGLAVARRRATPA